MALTVTSQLILRNLKWWKRLVNDRWNSCFTSFPSHWDCQAKLANGASSLCSRFQSFSTYIHFSYCSKHWRFISQFFWKLTVASSFKPNVEYTGEDSPSCSRSLRSKCGRWSLPSQLRAECWISHFLVFQRLLAHFLDSISQICL